ncbi:FtsK/SpoIIIE domain-containing protein [Streptomyces sp. NBC_00433]
MGAEGDSTGLLRISLNVAVDGPESYDLVVEADNGTRVADLVTALAERTGLPAGADPGLLRTMSTVGGVPGELAVGYLPQDALLAQCSLVEGTALALHDRGKRPAPTIALDTDRADDDLFLIDERGTHRGRVTRLPAGTEVTIGSAPGGGSHVLVDDRNVPGTALIVTNVNGDFAQCVVKEDKGLYLAGSPARQAEPALLPGSTITFRRGGTPVSQSRGSHLPDETDYVGFTLTTAAGLHERSPIGRVRFDVTARPADPAYDVMSEQSGTVPAQPREPEHQPYPYEQAVLPAAMLIVLYLVTHSYLTLFAAPAIFLAPTISHGRQRKQAAKRYAADRAEWRRRLETSLEELTQLAGMEEENLQRESPATEVWALRAYRRLAGLWSRSTERTDYLKVSLGWGELPSRYEVRLADGLDHEDPEFRELVEVEGRRRDRERLRPQLFDVPFPVSLRDQQLGLVGPQAAVNDVAIDVLVQVVCAHPPGSVAIAALLPASQYARRRYEWLKWLPHTRSGSTILPAQRLLAGRKSCNAFLLGVRDALLQQPRQPGTVATNALLVVHESAEVDLALLGEVCRLAEGAIRVLWLGTSPDTAPDLVTALARLDLVDEEVHGVLLSGDPVMVNVPFTAVRFAADPAITARALASLYDPSTSGASAGVPQSAPLSAVTPVEHVEPAALPRASLGRSLPVRLGVGEAGMFELDLVRDGPHVLIGGTTGSGKSELLQTMVCGLAGGYGPGEVSLFLVDFKGGATFAPFSGLPHVVGYVSDLGPRDVDRSLAFLRAELRRREVAFQEADNAKEYADYLQYCLDNGRRAVLPRLVVAFDEFATLVQEFGDRTISAVIDIAQRGRSWGVHLVLATQQPSRDVVVPKVRANVTARIALRTLASEESETIIDRPEAARIPRSIPGRALARLEGSTLLEFQTAHSGAPYVPRSADEALVLTDFGIDFSDVADVRPGSVPGRGESQLQRLVRAVRESGATPPAGAVVMPPALQDTPVRLIPTPSGLPDGEPRRPDRSPGQGRETALVDVLAVGLRDLPDRQRQDELRVDLAAGPLAVFGPNQSGRSGALAMLAEAFVGHVRGAAVPSVICFDSAERLGTALRYRFSDAVVVPIARSDHVTRCIDQLWWVMRSRMGRESGEFGIDADAPPADRVPVLVLIDGFDTLARSFASSAYVGWAGKLVELLTLGRRYGIHAGLASRDVRDLDNAIATVISQQVHLQAHDEEAGTAREDRLPGFGLDGQGNLVQLYAPHWAADGVLAADTPRLPLNTAMAAFLKPDGWRHAPSTAMSATVPGGSVLSLGVDEIQREPLLVNLSESHLLVVGPSKSGRTTMLRDAVAKLHEATGRRVAVLAAQKPEQWADAAGAHLISASDFLAAPEPARAAYFQTLGLCETADGRLLLVIDDAFALESPPGGAELGLTLADLFRRSQLQLMAASSAGFLGGMVGAALKGGGTTVYLRPVAIGSDVDDGYRVRGAPLRHRPGAVYVKGDAIVQTDEGQHLIHLGRPAESPAGRV